MCLQDTKFITFFWKKKKIVLGTGGILYVIRIKDKVEIHVLNNRIYITSMSLAELEKQLGDEFIKVHRGCLVSVKAIHEIADKIVLCNGEYLEYTIRKRKLIIEQFCLKQKNIFTNISHEGCPDTWEEYQSYYRAYENLPFAFTDIEMVFDEKKQAVDWIFRYGNPALARLEKLSLDALIGKSFSRLFSNMDNKWLQCYQRSTLYGEVLEMMEYSPEIDTNIKIISFPTFKGHCGCFLFNISDIEFVKLGKETSDLIAHYFRKNINVKN